MKTEIIESCDFDTVFEKKTEFLTSNEIVVVNSNYFFNRLNENHTIIISYYL